MNRNRIYSSQDFAVVGVPQDEDGKEMRQYLRRQELAGECKLDFTGKYGRHEDGRLYEDVAIISTHRMPPEDIACGAMLYHPDNEDAAIGVPCASCKGQGCQDCGFLGVQSL